LTFDFEATELIDFVLFDDFIYVQYSSGDNDLLIRSKWVSEIDSSNMTAEELFALEEERPPSLV
jgi:hypothetical protein